MLSYYRFAHHSMHINVVNMRFIAGDSLTISHNVMEDVSSSLEVAHFSQMTIKCNIRIQNENVEDIDECQDYPEPEDPAEEVQHVLSYGTFQLLIYPVCDLCLFNLFYNSMCRFAWIHCHHCRTHLDDYHHDCLLVPCHCGHVYREKRRQ